MDSSALALRVKIARIGAIAKKISGAKWPCMHPDCTEVAIGSHSQHKNGQIRSIAENQHVVAFTRNIKESLFASSPEDIPQAIIDRVGINEVTKFNGFCNNHDISLFSVIETTPLQKGNMEQVIAFHRRAMAYEIWNERKELKLYNQLLLDEPADGPMRAALECEIKRLAVPLHSDEQLAWTPLWGSSPAAQISFEWVVLEKNIGISLVSRIPILSDEYFMRYMSAHYDMKQGCFTTSRPSFSLVVCPTTDKTHVVMIWEKKDDDLMGVHRRRLLSSQERNCFLNECIFVKSEDFTMRPSLWDSINAETKAVISKGISVGFDVPVPNILSAQDVKEVA